MKIKSTAQLFGVGLGTALGSLALMSAPAFSATLNFFGTNEDLFLREICQENGGTPNDPNCENIGDNLTSTTKTESEKQSARDAISDDLRIAEVQGRGTNGSSRSLFLGQKGSNSPSDDPLDSTTIIWENGKNYDWTLNWVPSASGTGGEATFLLGDTTELFYKYTGTFNTFNALGLLTRADNGQAAKMDLSVTSYTVNNETIDTDSDNDFTLSSESDNFSDSDPNTEPSFQKKYFLLDDLSQDITQLTGTFAMSWNSSSDRPITPAVSFSIRLYDPDGEGNAQTTPEPGLMLGLLGVGTLGLVGRKRKMDAK